MNNLTTAFWAGSSLIGESLARGYRLMAYEVVLLVYSIPVVGPVCGGLGMALGEVASQEKSLWKMIVLSTVSAMVSVLAVWLFFMEGSLFSWAQGGVHRIVACSVCVVQEVPGALSAGEVKLLSLCRVVRDVFVPLVSYLPRLDPALVGLWPAIVQTIHKLYSILEEVFLLSSTYLGFVSPVLVELDLIGNSLSLSQWVIVFCIVRTLWNFLQANLTEFQVYSLNSWKKLVLYCVRVQAG